MPGPQIKQTGQIKNFEQKKSHNTVDSEVRTFGDLLTKDWPQLLVNESNGILLPKLFLPTVRKNCSSDREKLKAKNFQNFQDH